MKKNIIAYLLIAVSFAFLVTGCTVEEETLDVKQSAAAKLTVGEEQTALMTVDLTGGYSVEFATGAAYFYKGDSLDESDVIANAFVIAKDEYDEEIAYFEDNDSLEGEFKDLGNGVYSYTTEDSAEYFAPAEDDFYLKVVVQTEFLDEADSIYTHFSANSAE